MTTEQPSASTGAPTGSTTRRWPHWAKLSEALEAVVVARGHLYAFHRLSGTADLTLGAAVERLRFAGHDERRPHRA